MDTNNWWTASQLRDAIKRCEAECEMMVQNNAPPAAIYGRREGIKMLYQYLYEAERAENGGLSHASYYGFD